MQDKLIAQIVKEVFAKAQQECAVKSKHGLAMHISSQINLSSKTLERLYDKYLRNKPNITSPQKETIALLCKFLGCNDYADYLKQNESKVMHQEKEGDNYFTRQLKRKRVAFFIPVLLLFFWGTSTLFKGSKPSANETVCMTWADSLFVQASCDIRPYSKFGTKVIPLDKVKLNSFKKVKVSLTTEFFTENEEPLLWYYKNKNAELEFFTAPGLHPVNGETLKKVTPYMVEKYVVKPILEDSSLLKLKRGP